MLLGNLAKRLLLGHFTIENGQYYLDNLDLSWALSHVWLPVVGNIARRVALCIITFRVTRGLYHEAGLGG